MLILIIIFLAFFASVVLAGIALSGSSTKEYKQTASRLDALSAPQSFSSRDDVYNIRREERLSTLPWLDRLLQRLDLSARLRLLLYQAELRWTVGRLLLISVVGAIAAATLIYLRTLAVPLAFVVGLVASMVPFIFVIRKREKRFEQMRQFLPDALDLMGGAIRAGHSFSSAMSIAAKESPEPIKREFRQCFDEQTFGLDLRGALSNLQYRMPIGEVRMIVTAVLIHSESGGNLTEILDKVAHLIRENYRLRRQVRVHTAQGRMSGWVLAIMPVVLAFLLYLLNPNQMSLLWTHPTGRKMMYTSIALTSIGGLIIRKIVRIRI